jgi:hypothetical protein
MTLPNIKKHFPIIYELIKQRVQEAKTEKNGFRFRSDIDNLEYLDYLLHYTNDTKEGSYFWNVLKNHSYSKIVENKGVCRKIKEIEQSFTKIHDLWI